MLDYKIVEEIANENGLIISQKVRVYEGDVTTEEEYNPLTRQNEPITRYRRTNLVEEWNDKIEPTPKASTKLRLDTQLEMSVSKIALLEII